MRQEENGVGVLEEGSLGPSPQVRPSAYNAFQVPTLIPSGTEVLPCFPITSLRGLDFMIYLYPACTFENILFYYTLKFSSQAITSTL